MSLLKSVKQYFSKYCETQENHSDELLRTHYYKTTKSNAMSVIQTVISRLPGYKITSVSTDHGEMSVQLTAPKKAFIIITVVSVRPLETAVDFTITYEGIINLGYTRQIAGELYRVLNKELVHIGNGITNADKM